MPSSTAKYIHLCVTNLQNSCLLAKLKLYTHEQQQQKKSPDLSLPQHLSTAILLSVSRDLTPAGTSHSCDCPVSIFSWLACRTECNIFRLPPCCVYDKIPFTVVAVAQSLSRVRLFATP